MLFSGMPVLSIITINPYIESRSYAVESSSFPMQTNTWKNMSPSLSPSARSYIENQMVYDAKAKRTILFGGRDYWVGSQNDTWAYDYGNNTWIEMKPIKHPSNRDSCVMVYDSMSDRIILFGGWKKTGGGLYNDTWGYDYNNNTWSNLTPKKSPPARVDPSMSYNSKSDRIIMFGGTQTLVPFGDTWIYDYNNNTWIEIKPSRSPPARWGQAMAYDSESDRIILFSGNTWGGSPPNDVWEYNFNSNNWTDITPNTRPVARTDAGIAYDSQMDRIILFGGSYPQYPPHNFNDTWLYDYHNNEWTNMSPVVSPSPREMPSMCYDIENGQIILFGGVNWTDVYGDTWTYELSNGNLPPYIVSTAPQNGSTNVGDNTKIVIQWSEPMNRISANAAFSVSPLISCSWSWNGVYQSCEPLKLLLSHTNYTVKISTVAADLSGKHMLANYTFKFTTDSSEGSISITNISLCFASIIVAILIVGAVFVLISRGKKKKENKRTV